MSPFLIAKCLGSSLERETEKLSGSTPPQGACGSSCVVERHLAKVEAESESVYRSIFIW